MPRFDGVLITGASSGIGQALALACAAAGVRLHLCGRNERRLAATAKLCRERGADVDAILLDVRDAAAAEAWIKAAAPLDLVIANAGIAGRKDGRPETDRETMEIFATNLQGVLNTVLPAIAVMRAQPARSRHIAVIASIAAFVASPIAPAYCASKAAVDTWIVALAPALRQDGILLSSVCPGFIRTPMTADNPFPMPGLIDADRAAAIILRGIGAGRTRIAFPRQMAIAARLGALLPPRLLARFMSRRIKARS